MSDQRIVSVYVDEEMRFRDSMCIIGRSIFRSNGDVLIGGIKNCWFLRNLDDLRNNIYSYNFVIWLREPSEEERSVIESNMRRPNPNATAHNINELESRIPRPRFAQPRIEDVPDE